MNVDRWVHIYSTKDKLVSEEVDTVPVPQWIPVTERLPRSNDTVIVSIRDDAGDTRFDYTSCGWVTTDGEYWIVGDEINNYVVAWMPLPKPWEGGET